MNQLSERSRAIIESARREGGATSAQRARVKAAVEARIMARVPPATAASWAVGLAVAGIAIAGIGLARSRSRSTGGMRPLAVHVESSQHVTRRSPDLVMPAAPSREATGIAPTAITATALPEEHPSRPAARRAMPPSLALASSRVARGGTLEDEVVLIGAARRALRNGAPAMALDVLAQHTNRFPDGALRDERRLLRVRSLCALGRTADAVAEARAIADDAPASPLADQARSACVSSAPLDPSHRDPL